MTDSPTAAASTPNAVFSTGFFRDPDFDFEARTALGNAAQGFFDVGLVLATIARVKDGDADSWYVAWRAAADALHAEAEASATAGHQQAAARFFLGAADAYSRSIGFSDAMTDQTLFAPVFALHRAAFDAFVDASGAAAQRVAVPYENTTLPGYLFRPDDSGAPRPTLVLTNGSDGSISSLWAAGASTAVARGWNAFLYDGPGQQTMLFDHGVPFRPDWEAVLTPVVDTLAARTDVDATRLLAYGISQAGYWLPRALAFEKRFVAAVADPGVMDVSTSWTAHLPTAMIDLLTSGDSADFNGGMQQASADPKLAATLAFRRRPYGMSTDFDTYTAVLGYNLRDVVQQISTPLLITSPDDEQFWPGQSQQLFDALPGEKVLARFTREQGANFHCQPLGRQLTEARMFGFFDEQLGRAG
ncbi:alpha/beta hydrolase family protein [Herbiconiux daphne]|uniref:Dipeptidyl aminopeptidase n=1 Tax=Herbiconiux daphne TaxID=2970914 RepID=A0ABT2GYE3_9MICO|nr:dipeptidyl aminopeptidase [Herbiconiux daphne]MCS5732975.1 dipeptidyl aminopeptidase [Herbiconiux daphne]